MVQGLEFEIASYRHIQGVWPIVSKGLSFCLHIGRLGAAFLGWCGCRFMI